MRETAMSEHIFGQFNGAPSAKSVSDINFALTSAGMECQVVTRDDPEAGPRGWFVCRMDLFSAQRAEDTERLLREKGLWPASNISRPGSPGRSW